MKKISKKWIFFSIIAIVFIVIAIKILLPYRWGYFVEGPQMKYEHNGDFITLENGDVLILGNNSHESPYGECRGSM